MAIVTVYACDICNKTIDIGKGIMMCDYHEIVDQSENYEKVALHDRGYVHYHKTCFVHYHKTCFINNMLHDEMKNDTRLSKHVKEVLKHIN